MFPHRIRLLLPLGHLHTKSLIANCRYCSTHSYMCDDAWRSNVGIPELLSGVDMDKFYLSIDRAFNVNGTIPAIDVEIFSVACSLCSHSHSTNLRHLSTVLRRFRHASHTASPQSTSHAVVRAHLSAACLQEPSAADESPVDSLLALLDDPVNRGVFLDAHSAWLLLSHLVRCASYRSAAKVAAHLMLQEEPDLSPQTTLLALYSCCMYLEAPDSAELYPTPTDETEVEYVRVHYLRDPDYSDGHFDLKSDSKRLMAKTMYWLSTHTPSPTHHSCSPALVAAWGDWISQSCRTQSALVCDNWADVERHLAAVVAADSEQCYVHSHTLRTILERLDSCAPTAAETAESGGTSEAAPDTAGDARERVRGLTTHLLAHRGAEATDSLTQALRRVIDTQEHTDFRSRLCEQYRVWGEERASRLAHQRELESRQESIARLDEKRRELRERYRLLHFFDHEQTLVELADKHWHQPARPKPARVLKVLRRFDSGEDRANYIPTPAYPEQ